MPRTKRFAPSNVDNLENRRLFLTARRAYNPASCFYFVDDLLSTCWTTTSTLLERVQRLEDEQAALRGQSEGERQLRILTVHIAAAAQAAPAIGAAIERFAKAMRAPSPLPPRGRAGGLARAKSAWRYFDGTFMRESEKEVAYREQYERYAAGGRARAMAARRAEDGTFLAMQAAVTKHA